MDGLTRGWAGRFAAASADAVRARIAAEMQRARVHDVRVGRIVLRPHQAEAVPRLREHLRAHGGALLADAVGLGKTFVALALAQGTRAPVVVAPAALREMWSDAARQAGVSAPRFVSVESLSRGASCALGTDEPDLLIVDEAHHVRTPATRRYAAVRSESVV